MLNPKAGKRYHLIRVQGGEVQGAEYTRYADGSAFVEANGFITIYENEPDVWREALHGLFQDGYIELREAKMAGLVPSGWEPEQPAV